jgi:glycosyltransferase involved in cell wall biosynthesis
VFSTSAHTVTFAIPYYKGRAYLARAVRSVLAQSEGDWRLMVRDDSTDGSAEPVLDAVGDPRVRYERNPHNLGMAGNWNRCIESADTDLVTLLHADDELLPDYCRLMRRAAGAHPTAAGLFCRAKIIGPDGNPTYSLPDRVKDHLVGWGGGPVRLRGPEGIASLLRGNFIMCPTVCYRKSVLGPARFGERWKFVLDLDMFARLLASGRELIGVPEFGYAYRRHPGNATTAYTESLLRFQEEVGLYDELAAEARQRGWVRVARVGRQKRIIRLHLAFRIVADFLRGHIRAAVAQYEFLSRMGSAHSAAPAHGSSSLPGVAPSD